MHPIFLTSLDDTLTFGSPEWLWGLLLLLPILAFFIQSGRKRGELLAKILAPRLQEQLAGRVSPFKRTLRLVLLLLSLALIILALAQPRYGDDQQTIKSNGRDVVIAIDTSRSMLSTDTAPSRLGRAKLISQDLLNLLKGDRVGVIAFAGTAFLQAPLTLDKGAVLTSINDLDTGTIPKGGTDIAAAIQMAIAAFGKGEGTSRALVIMTDGEELEASGVEAAKEAAALGIRIFTVGFGSAEGSLIPIKTESGQNDFVRDENGNPVNSKLDASRLTDIAKETGGFYQPYGQDAATVIYDKGIVPIEAQERGTLTARKPIERYAWPATAALILLALWSVLGEGRGRRAGLIVAAGLLLSPLSPRTVLASGLSDYKQGNYQGALHDFEKRIQSGKATAEVRFDAGAAAYKAGDYKKAAEYFSEAMTSSNQKIRDAATYNLANSLVRTGEAAKEKEAKLSDWKNSLQHYDTVLKSAPGNTSAKENREIVKKLIEDLKKQQEQQKQQDKKDDQKKDQKDQKDKDQQKNQDQKKEDSKDQDQKDQQKNDQSQKDSQSSKDSGGKDQKSQDQKDSKAQSSPSPQQGKEDQKGGASPTPTPAPSPSPNPSASPDQGKGSDAQKQDQQGAQKQDASQQPTPSDGQKNQDQQNSQGGQPSPTPASSPEERKEGKIGGGEQGAKPEEKSEEQKAAETAAAGDESKDGKMSPNQARALLHSVQDEEQHVLNQQQRGVDQTLHDW